MGNRSFMTVPEAVQLAIQAAAIGRGGEALVLDMGESVRIADVDQQLASQSPVPIEIVYTGLRPGEKRVEDLLGDGEVDERPIHPLNSHVVVQPLSAEDALEIPVDGHVQTLRAKLIGWCHSDAATPVSLR